MVGREGREGRGGERKRGGNGGREEGCGGRGGDRVIGRRGGRRTVSLSPSLRARDTGAPNRIAMACHTTVPTAAPPIARRHSGGALVAPAGRGRKAAKTEGRSGGRERPESRAAKWRRRSSGDAKAV